jgi:hypothetical protein
MHLPLFSLKLQQVQKVQFMVSRVEPFLQWLKEGLQDNILQSRDRKGAVNSLFSRRRNGGAVFSPRFYLGL